MVAAASPSELEDVEAVLDALLELVSEGELYFRLPRRCFLPVPSDCLRDFRRDCAEFS